jgi:hypothetical protein
MFDDRRGKLPRQDDYLWWSLWLLLALPLIPLAVGWIAVLTNLFR